MSTDTLTLADAVALADVLTAAQTCAKVYRMTENGDPVFGTARAIVAPDSAAFLRSTDDVRDGRLWVTTHGGWEAFWPVRELVAAARRQEFGRYDWS